MNKTIKHTNENENLIPLAIKIMQTHKDGLYSEKELSILFNAIEIFNR